MEKTKLRRLCVIAAMVALPFAGDAQLLKGKTEGSVRELQLAISLDGDQGATEYKTLELKDDGTFEFDAVLPSSFIDVIVYVNDGECVGAHLERGKTLELILRGEKNGPVEYTFKGDGKALSEFYTRFARAFDFMRYFPMDPSQEVSCAENLALLEKETKAVESLLPTIADPELCRYYTRLASASEKYLRIRLLMNETQETSAAANAEYRSLVDAIDVNDEISMRSGLSGEFIHGKISKDLLAFGGDLTPWALVFMDTVDHYVTNPAVKKAMARNCAYMYFTFSKGGDYLKFWDTFRAFAADYPDLIQANEGIIVAMNKTAKGTDAIDAVLENQEGKTCRLSDLFGKFTYIDVWATWCGPCCAEIPHLEKLAVHFKDESRVQFISLSVDTDKKAWLAKLEKDQPEWAQYILSPNEAKRFMQAWGISGIPRFIMIDKDGKIFAADALRPSDENIIPAIEAALTENK